MFVSFIPVAGERREKMEGSVVVKITVLGKDANEVRARLNKSVSEINAKVGKTGWLQRIEEAFQVVYKEEAPPDIGRMRVPGWNEEELGT
jgi:hypothetical protein